MDRSGRALLQQQGNSWSCFIGEQRSDETPEASVVRIVRESAGIELPFFTKLLEHDEDAWFLVALDSWPPLKEGLLLIDAEQALQASLEWNTRYVLEWFIKPSEAYVYPPAREAAEA